MIGLLVVPFLACLALVAIHVVYGHQILKKGILFLDLAVAQWAALGYLVGHYLHVESAWMLFGISFVFTFIPALVLTMSKTDHDISAYSEAVIGVLYVLAAALAVTVVSVTGMELHHFQNMLVGHLLFVTTPELLSALAIYAAIGSLYWIFRHKLAHSRGRELLFYLSFGLVVTSSVKLAGILAVFSFLVLPLLTFVRLGLPARRWLGLAWGWGGLASLIGLVGAVWLDLPPGIAIILVLCVGWLLAMVWHAVVLLTRRYSPELE